MGCVEQYRSELMECVAVHVRTDGISGAVHVLTDAMSGEVQVQTDRIYGAVHV